MFPKTKMRVFFSLMVLSFMLATCEGACWREDFKPELIDGEMVKLYACLDRYDGRRHLIGSKWKTADCSTCECGIDGMSCCNKPVGVAVAEGCRTVVNPETCEYEFYRLDDPSRRCF